MFKLISELCKCMAVMNTDGMALLVCAAKDITSRDKYRKEDGELTPQEFYRQADQSTSLCDRNYRRECAA